MDALAGVAISTTSGAYQDNTRNTVLAQLGQRLQISDGPKPLSLVGYDRPELLLAAIREHHVRVTGRTLASKVSFGGHLTITAEALSAIPSTLLPDEVDRGTSRGSYSELVQDKVSAEAYRFATSSFPGLKQPRESPQSILESMLGPEALVQDELGIFETLLELPFVYMSEILEALDLPAVDYSDFTEFEYDKFVAHTVIPRIRAVTHYATVQGNYRAHVVRAGDSLRDVEAGHRIQLVRAKATAALSEHYSATRLSREALQDIGELPLSPANIDSMPVVLLQGIIDYLNDNKMLMDNTTSSVTLSVGGRSPQRTRTICVDPDAEMAAIIRSKDITYAGGRFERFLCLVPLGAALVTVVIKYFQPSSNTEIDSMIDSLKTLSFMDHQRRLSVGPGYSVMSNLLAKVSRSGMSFNVAKTYEHLAKAMALSSHSAQDSGAWRELCHITMRTSQSYSNNSVMPRSVLDATMATVRAKMDFEADSQGLEFAFTGLDPREKTATVSAISAYDHGDTVAAFLIGDDQDEEDDFAIHYVGTVGKRMCPCGDSMPRFSDYCGTCRQFFPGTMICALCRTPKFFPKEDDGLPKRCRMFGTSAICKGGRFVEPERQDYARMDISIEQRNTLHRERGGAGASASRNSGIAPASQLSSTGGKGNPQRGKPEYRARAKQLGDAKYSKTYKPHAALPATAPVQASVAIAAERVIKPPEADVILPIKSGSMIKLVQPPDDRPTSDGIIRIYNIYGYDRAGEPGPGASIFTEDLLLRMGPFDRSQNGLDEHGLDMFMTVPYPASESMAIELEQIKAFKAQSLVAIGGASDDTSLELGPLVPIDIGIHIVVGQSENILAACDIERAGMVLVTVKTSDGLVSWLAMGGGGGILLQRQNGLLYLFGRVASDGGISIGDGGEIRFLIDTGAQVSLAGEDARGLLIDVTPATVALKAVGGCLLNPSMAGILRIKYVPGVDSMVNLESTPPGEVPPMLIISERPRANESAAAFLGHVRSVNFAVIGDTPLSDGSLAPATDGFCVTVATGLATDFSVRAAIVPVADGLCIIEAIGPPDGSLAPATDGFCVTAATGLATGFSVRAATMPVADGLCVTEAIGPPDRNVTATALSVAPAMDGRCGNGASGPSGGTTVMSAGEQLNVDTSIEGVNYGGYRFTESTSVLASGRRRRCSRDLITSELPVLSHGPGSFPKVKQSGVCASVATVNVQPVIISDQAAAMVFMDEISRQIFIHPLHSVSVTAVMEGITEYRLHVLAEFGLNLECLSSGKFSAWSKDDQD